MLRELLSVPGTFILTKSSPNAVFVTIFTHQSFSRLTLGMAIKQISYCAEKLVLVLFISLLLLQIFLSVKDYIRKEYVDTRVEDQLYNVDFPMIVLCAEKPQGDGLNSLQDDLFYNLILGNFCTLKYQKDN